MKKLPLPSLEDTQNSFIEHAKALLDENELNKSLEISNRFFEQFAPNLQSLLQKEKDLTATSWLYKFWLNSYLASRGVVSIDSNFSLNLNILEDFKDKKDEEILNIFSSSLARVCKDYKEYKFGKIFDARDNEICLNHFQILKGASRIPQKNVDGYNLSQINSNFISVFYKNNLYKIEVFDDSGMYDIKNAISNIINSHSQEGLLSSISFLPTQIAGEIRDDLYLSNQFFDIVENSLFNISIIDKEFKNDEEKRHFMLYLDGTNSWMFKPLNFIFNLHDKSFFINVEHSFQDAGSIIEIIDRAKENLTKQCEFTQVAKEVLIKEYIDEENTAKIKQYLAQYKETIGGLSCKDLHFKFDEKLCEGFSKDSIMQFILLFAQYKTYGNIRGVYEAVDVREYSFGRTECVRVVSEEAVKFVKALDKNEDKNKLLELLKEANNRHKTRIKTAKKANGVDRHLFGLLSMVEKTSDKQQAMEFFNDIAYKKVSENFISTTSTGVQANVGYLLFAPVEASGLGITYLKPKDEIIFLVSFYKNNQNKADDFEKNILIAIEKLKELLS